MSHRIVPALFAMYLTSTAAQAAPLPEPVAVLLQQIRGEWIVLDQNSLSTRLRLLADGSGQLANRDGTASISWRLDAGSIRIQVLEPITGSWMEYQGDQKYRVFTTLQTMTLEFTKLEGLSTILWKMSSQSQITYPDNLEKVPLEVTAVSENVRLVAGRQFKKLAPQVGQILSLDLPDFYTDVGGDFPAAVSILARLDKANQLTLLRGQEIVQDTLFWTLENGSLRVSDGKGYTVSYRLFKSDKVSAQLLAEVQSAERSFISDQEAIYSDETLRAEGFRADSALLQGCWTAFQGQTDYCFNPNRLFSFISHYSDSEIFTNYGLWRLEGGQVHVDRYTGIDGMPLIDLTEMLDCEKELANATVNEKSCQVFQTRSYELLNQNADGIGVYRILKQSDFASYTAHVFKRKN